MAYTGSYPAAPAAPRDPTEVIGRRIVAFLVDLIILWAIMIAVGAALSKSYSNAPSDACQILRDQGVSARTCFQSGARVYVLSGSETATMWFVGFVVWLGNYVLLQGATGATVGKFMLGLRCVNAQGETCGMGRAFVRSLLLIVDEFFCFLVGLITVNVTHPHQRVGDLVAKTYVVETNDVGVPIAGAAPVAAATWGQPPPPAWGQQQPPSAWGQPQQQPPAWGQPQPPAWGQPAQQPPAYGQQPPAPQSPWGAPPAPPPAPRTWEQPPAQQAPPPSPVWDTPAPQQSPPPPPAAPVHQQPPQQPPQQTGPASWGTPPEQAPPPPPPPPEPAAPPPAPPAQPRAGESWWDKAVESDGDDESTQ